MQCAIVGQGDKLSRGKVVDRKRVCVCVCPTLDFVLIEKASPVTLTSILDHAHVFSLL